MIIICLVLPLLFFSFTTYWLNIRKLKQSKGKIVVLSILETVSSYLLVLLLYLQGFYTIIGQVFISLIAFLIIGIIYTYLVKGVDAEWDFQNENIKNNLILFTLILLPFMIFLTIFRFINPALQIVLSLLLTALVFFISFKIRTFTRPITGSFDTNFSLASDAKYLYLVLVLLVLFMVSFIIDLPLNSMSRFLNLYDNTPYMAMDGFPTDIQNDYKEQTIFELNIEESINKEGIDYYYDEHYLYLYNKTHVYVFDLATNQLYNTLDIGSYNVNIDTITFLGLYPSFIEHNDDLLLLGVQGLYLITPDSAIKISTINSNFSRAFYIQDDLYFLSKILPTQYTEYLYSDGQVNITNTLSIPSSSFDDIEVISNKFFYKVDDRFVLRDDDSVSFLYYDGTATYDAINEDMYYVRSRDYPSLTEYYKVSSDGTVERFEVNRVHNTDSMAINNTLYLTNFNTIEDNRVEMINQDFEISGFKTMYDRQPFWISNFFSTQYIVNFHSNNNQLEYLQIDSNLKHSIIKLSTLNQEPVALKLPFYSHFGIGYFIPIIIAWFVPITDYRKHHRILSFEEATKKKEDK